MWRNESKWHKVNGLSLLRTVIKVFVQRIYRDISIQTFLSVISAVYSSRTQNKSNIVLNFKDVLSSIRVAELGSLSSGAKMATKIFVKRVFIIFATKASFLRVIANLQI